MDGAGRRSVYQEVRRNYMPSMMLAFDTPPPAGTVGRRNVSNVPAQALILSNDPFVAQQAKLWAERTIEGSLLGVQGSAQSTKDEGQTTKGEVPHTNAKDFDVERRIELLFLESFARRPNKQELSATIDFLKNQAAAYKETPWKQSEQAWTDLCHAILNAKEFLFVP